MVSLPTSLPNAARRRVAHANILRGRWASGRYCQLSADIQQGETPQTSILLGFGVRVLFLPLRGSFDTTTSGKGVTGGAYVARVRGMIPRVQDTMMSGFQADF